jgi:ribokinase
VRILNIGSINIDEVFSVARFVQPAETIPCRSYARHAGGKGNNQSVALARAGAEVCAAGKVGADGAFLVAGLKSVGVDVSRVIEAGVPTGRAIIQVDGEGQNCIILLAGANDDISEADIDAFLAGWGEGDSLLLQNETSGTGYILAEAARRGLKVFFNPSPVKENLADLPLRKVDWLLLNEVEGAALAGLASFGAPAPIGGYAPDAILSGLRSRFPRANLVLTLGAEGVRYAGADGSSLSLPAEKVEVVDTTGAGDTFTGFFIAGLLRGDTVEAALRDAVRAASVCVMRPGAAESIPTRAELKK